MKKLSTLFLAAMFACSASIANAGSLSSVTLITSDLNSIGGNGAVTLLDGDLTQYAPTFSNAIDGLDARKMSNPGENIGLERDNVCLAIERRETIQSDDTIFYKTWNLLQATTYQLAFDPTDMEQPGLSAFLQDTYLNTNTPVSLSSPSAVNFTINANPASSNIYRFRLIFVTAFGGTPPITFTNLKAFQQNSAINIDWNTASENNMKDYTVQRSVDGKNFGSLATVPAGKLLANYYSYVDQKPASGSNYYRIANTDLNGNTKYSEILLVNIESGISFMKVFPNPVINRTINLQVVNQPKGLYTIRLVSNFGQQISITQMQHPGGSGTFTLTPTRDLAPGIYQVEVLHPDGERTSISVVY